MVDYFLECFVLPPSGEISVLQEPMDQSTLPDDLYSSTLTLFPTPSSRSDVWAKWENFECCYRNASGFFLMAQHVDRPHIVVEPETGLLLLAALITTYRGLFIYADSKRLGPELLVVPLC